MDVVLDKPRILLTEQTPGHLPAHDQEGNFGPLMHDNILLRYIIENTPPANLVKHLPWALEAKRREKNKVLVVFVAENAGDPLHKLRPGIVPGGRVLEVLVGEVFIHKVLKSPPIDLVVVPVDSVDS